MNLVESSRTARESAFPQKAGVYWLRTWGISHRRHSAFSAKDREPLTQDFPLTPAAIGKQQKEQKKLRDASELR
jgi:hypothetical protein